MKTQSLPLALCLFLTLFLTSLYGYSKNYSFKNTAEVAKIKATSTSDTPELVLRTLIVNSKKEKPFDASNQSSLDASESSQKNVVKEFSYKQTSSFSGTMESFSANYATHEASFLQRTSFLQGMFYGFSVMIALLNLVCFILFNEKLFLHFSLAIASFSILFFVGDGLFQSLFLENTIETTYVLSALLTLVAGATFLFSSHYLRLCEMLPKLRLVMVGMLGISSMTLLLATITEDTLLVALANTVSFGVIGTYFVMGVKLFSKKNYAKFYVIASAIPLLFLFDFFVLQRFGISFLSTEILHLKVAGFIQMLLLTYAIMYRMKEIKEENELRLTEMRIFMKRQEIMNRKNVERLMEDVYLENLIMHYDLDGLEIKLLQYISEGKPNAKIARKLKMTETDVEELTKELYQKLEVGEQIQEDHRMLEDQPDYIYN
ncbi:7TM diverse intracellular signaling domain-containing protein [Jejudonia soesokkakensis]|uniref:7TM diverse intracellular signaling domain-containing protein n=1 Tax=Jejudonia soesokkakensis TaxID=1323432 RepID=A0ABW2MY62_9FLAO